MVVPSESGASAREGGFAQERRCGQAGPDAKTSFMAEANDVKLIFCEEEINMPGIKDTIKAFGVKQVLSYVDRDFDKNAVKVCDWLLAHDKGGGVTSEVKQVREVITDPNSNWYQLIKSVYTDIDDGVRARLFENFIINGCMIGTPMGFESAVKYNCNVPWAILMDPTSACNLHCTGCWAAEYGNKLNLTLEELDSIITQGEALGTYFYIYSGGEPLVRKKDIITLCERHPECAFLSFTNGTLIDEAFADEMLRVKNFVPAISVEGFEEATDFRRGEGTYASVLRAMKILKERKLLFGCSCCYTSKNVDSIGSEEYFDAMIDMGCKFMWLFTYMPVGVGATTDLMATAEQREYMYHFVRDMRNKKALFTMDFWNDGEYADGCIAGGRRYLHINANGDVEPCAFIHFSDSNIREKTLLEALQSPLFMAYHDGQPFNENMLRPCPLLDNQGRLAEMVDASGAHSTDLQQPEDVHALCAKCRKAADCWQETSQQLWEASGGPEKWEAKKVKLAEREEEIRKKVEKKK